MTDAELLFEINKRRLHPYPASFMGAQFWKCEKSMLLPAPTKKFPKRREIVKFIGHGGVMQDAVRDCIRKIENLEHEPVDKDGYVGHSQHPAGSHEVTGARDGGPAS